MIFGEMYYYLKKMTELLIYFVFLQTSSKAV